MKVLFGKTVTEISQERLNATIANYKSVVVDLGTGDARFIYKQALDSMNKVPVFYIGIDPSIIVMQKTAQRIAKNKLKNILLVNASFEQLPGELFGIADKLYIVLPWGTLLKSIVFSTKSTVDRLYLLLKPKGVCEIILGYNLTAEPSETTRLDLPDLTYEYLKNFVLPVFESGGFSILSLCELNKTELGGLNTTWSKKLKFGRDRLVFKIVLCKDN